MQIRPFTAYTVKPQIGSLKLALGLFILEIIIGVVGFMLIEEMDLLKALYMTVITISTVGFGEVAVLSSTGRIFTIILILVNMIIFAYALYVATYHIFEGKLFRKMHTDFIENRINNLKDHIILCGFGRYGREAAHHFLGLNLDFVIVEKDPEVIKLIQESPEKFLYLEGDATDDSILLKARIENAKAIITAMPDDTDNVYTVLTSRQLNPKTHVISRARNHMAGKKLKMAGADQVIIPEQIGGFYMAALVSKPNAVEFFSFISTEYDQDLGLEEMPFAKIPEDLQGKNIHELMIRENSGANIIGVKTPEGRFIINPEPEFVLTPRSSFILLGDTDQLKKLRSYFKLS